MNGLSLYVMTMNKSHLPFMPEFFDRYIQLTDDCDLTHQLDSGQYAFEAIRSTLEALTHQRYAVGKWTVNEVLQHITDNERIQSYRALCLARGERQALPGYDEASYGEASLANRRSISELIREFEIVRAGSMALFNSMDPDMMVRVGICGGRSLTPLALGLVLVGHQLHHMHILQDRYFPLVQSA